MILNLYIESQRRQWQNKWWFTLAETNEIVARAVNGANMHTVLWYGKNKYQFKNIPKVVEKVALDFKYPYSSTHKKTIGFNIFENTKPIAESHWDALRCRESGINKNIGVNVFKYNGLAYLLFHVGLPKHASSYFCLYENGGELVAVIARHHSGKEKDNCRATLYIKDDKDLLITLLACTSKIIDVANYRGKDGSSDSSAGPLISTLEEARELYNPDFIGMVKGLENHEWKIEPLEISQKDLQLATEMSDKEKERQYDKKTKLEIKIMFYALIIICIISTILKLLGIELVF